MEEIRKMLDQHEKSALDMYRNNRLDLAFRPQPVRDAIIKLEEELHEAILHDSDALARLIRG